MAGIGLRLHKAATKGGYLEAATAYLSSAVISSGPWLTAVITISLLGGASASYIGKEDRLLLFATITYAFGSSLVVSGVLQMVLTRYLADRLYLGDSAVLSPTCSGILVIGGPVWLITLPYILLAPFSLSYRLVTAALFVVLTLIWLVATFLSAARDYLRVLLIFVLSYAVSFVGAIVAGHAYGVIGSLTGFAFGQMLCLALMVARIYREFPPLDGLNFAFLSYLTKYWELALVGLLYMVGIWADNVIYWFSPVGIVVGHFYRLYPDYDAPKLIAYLATIPASAVFLVHLETNFYGHYRDFFVHIREKGTLRQIAAAKEGMVESLRSGLATIFIVQGIVDTLLFLIAPALLDSLGLGRGLGGILRIEILAVSCQFLLLAVLILLLYLDERAGALAVVSTFALGNIGATLATTHLGRSFVGTGYLAASVLAALVALVLLVARMRRLEFRTFMLQPMS